MVTYFTMPKLGLNMTAGHIIRWLVGEGASVKAGQPLIEIETDKAVNEVEAPTSGMIGKILHAEGEDVPCNSVLAVILSAGEALPHTIPAMIGGDSAPRTEVAGKRIDSASQPSADKNQAAVGGRVSASPSARKLAREMGVDLARVIPSGSQIKRRDVERVYQQTQAAPAKGDAALAYRSRPYTGIRKITGEHMAVSVHSTARVALSLQVDAENLTERKKAFELTLGRVSYNVLIAEQAAKTLKAFPYLNASLVGEEIREMEAINIGIAVDTPKGLYVPVLRNADQKSAAELNQEFQDLAVRTKAGQLSARELEGGTFTITNLGAFEIEAFIPVINLPECAILAVGAILPKAAVVNNQVAVRKMMTLTLVFDHRIVDGAPAARFLQRVKQLLELKNP